MIPPDALLQQILDVFNPGLQARAAEHWTAKGGEGGYSPVCRNKFNKDRCLIKKGRPSPCNNCPAKEYLPLDLGLLRDHANGGERRGIYPLLPGDICHWVAADFDNHGGTTPADDDVRKVLQLAGVIGLPVAVFSSNSGKGYHVYVFFDRACPAPRARRLLREVCTRAGVGKSLDDLFPKQDSYSGLDLGNLLAMPWNGKAYTERQSTLFLDPGSLQPYGASLAENIEMFLEYHQPLTAEALTELEGSLGIGMAGEGDKKTGYGIGNGSSKSGVGTKNPDGWVQDMLLDGIDEGKRNVEMTRLAGYFLGIHKNAEMVRNILLPFNQHNVRPPLSEVELNRIIDSLLKREGVDKLAALLNLPITQFEILEYADEAVKYRISTEERKIVLTPEELNSFQLFRVKMMILTRKRLDMIKDKEWSDHVNRLLFNAQVVAVPKEETSLPDLAAVICQGIKCFREANDDPGEQLHSNGICTNDNTIYMKMSWLQGQVKGTDALRWMTKRDVVAHLKKLGFTYPDITKRIGNYTFRVWEADLFSFEKEYPVC